MKVQIELDPTIQETVVHIRCKEIDQEIQKLQTYMNNQLTTTKSLSFYKEGKECYVSLDDILFFETEDHGVFAHSKDDVYLVKYRLYELENMLPPYFTRVAKSTILNIKTVYSIDRNLTSYSLVQFYHSHKQVYVSRFYYKSLKHKLDERRNL